MSWQQARELVVEDSRDLGWFQAPANVAFVIIGWLYGEDDFGQSVLTAINCGDDTDCTGATLGALLGILLGKDGIPAQWPEPIGERILTIAIDRGSMWGFLPATLSELTERVLRQIPLSLGAFAPDIRISDAPADLSEVQLGQLTRTEAAKAIWSRSPYAVEFDCIHTQVTVDYCREPKVQAGKAFPMRVTLTNTMPDCRHVELRWQFPDDWQVLPARVSHHALNHHPPTCEAQIEVIPGAITHGTITGTLEVRGTGRVTVGVVPLCFFGGE